MITFRNIEVIKTLQISKNEFKDLSGFLKRNDLIDNRSLWFAGFDNYRKASNNALAENLFYGNKRLIIICINDNEVFYINNSKEGLKVRLLGNKEDKFHLSSLRLLLHPTVNIKSPQGLEIEIKVTKNKGIIKEFKKALK